MQDSFDPYLEWLDVPEGPRPPDHYALLGLTPPESDPQRIAQAADVRMAKVRRVRPGVHLARWGQLLDQLNAAKVCLLNPASKAAYDASLSNLAPSRPAAPQTPGPMAGYPATLAAPPTLAGAAQQPAAASVPSEPSGLPAFSSAEAATPYASSHGLTAPTPQTAPPQPDPPTAMPPISAPVPWQSTPAAPPTGRIPPGEPAFVEPAMADPVVSAAPARRPATAGKKSGGGLAVGVLLILIVGLGGVFYYVIHRGPQRAVMQGRDAKRTETESPPAMHSRPQRPPTPEETPQPAEEPATDPEPDVSQAESPRPTQPQQQVQPQQPVRPDPEPPTSKPVPEKPAPKPDAKKQAAYGQAVSDARFSMSERDLAAARRHLGRAAGNAQTPADQAEIARLQTMLGHLDEFWNGMRESISQLAGGQELVLKNTRVAVVEASRSELLVKAAGRLRSWRVEDVPTSIVMAVVQDAFPKDATSKVQIGTFLAVDARGDPAYARQLWQEAAREEMDVRDLMPELDRNFASDSGVAKVAPPTDQARLAQAEQWVRLTFQNAYAQATSNVKKNELAHELLARGQATRDNPDARFVMFREARDLAVAVGEPALAGEAIDQMAKFFTIDTVQMKVAALEAMDKESRTLSSPNRRELVMRALSLCEQAVEANRLGEAERLATLALAAARKSRSRTLMKQALGASERVSGLRKQN